MKTNPLGPLQDIGPTIITKRSTEESRFNYIANASLLSSSGRTIPMLDPSNGQPYDEIQRSNASDVDLAVRAARQGFEAVWHKLS